MADVVHRATCAVLLSVNTPDFVPGWRKGEPVPTDGDYAIVPRAEAEAALAIPQRYRKMAGNAVVEMDAVEKAAVDAAEAASREAAQRAADKAMLESGTLDRVLAVLAPKLGTDEAALKAEVVAAIDAKPSATDKADG